MAVRISSITFARYMAAQSTTRVTKVREAKRVMEASPGDFPRIDYWLALREAAVGRLLGNLTPRAFNVKIAAVTDAKKTVNYRAAAEGLQKWIGRKSITASLAPSKKWRSSGLEVAVTPELVLSWPKTPPIVMKLYFSSDPLSKYQASPLLRLIEHTHRTLGTSAVLDVQRSKLHLGPTTRPKDLDLLLSTEATSFVSIWNSL
jgi:hypothetical protein